MKLLVFSLLLSAQLVGCGQKSDGGGKKSGNDKAHSQEESVDFSSENPDRYFEKDGLAVAKLSSDQSKQEISIDAPKSSEALKGSQVVFPAGTLQIPNGGEISIEEAAGVGNSSFFKDAGLDGEVTEAGKSILVSSADDLKVNGAFTIAIPGTASLRLASHKALFYKYVDPKDPKSVKGSMIPLNEVEHKDGKFLIKGEGFGAYQIVTTSYKVTKKVEFKSSSRQILNAKLEAVVDENGLSHFASLRQTAVGYGIIPDFGHFINSHNVKKFPVKGRCSSNGGIITLSGALSKEVKCENYRWGFEYDFSKLSEGSHQLKISFSANSQEVSREVSLQKNTKKLEFTDEESHSVESIVGLKARVPLNVDDNTRREYIRFSKVSGPGLISSSKDADGYFFIIASKNGTYKVKAEVMDKFGNHASFTYHLNYDGGSTICDLIAPNMTLNTNDNSVFVSLSNNQNEACAGMVVVRSIGSEVTFVPENGTQYSVGDIDATQRIIDIAAEMTNDEDLDYGKTYHYAAFKFNTSIEYGPATKDSIKIVEKINNRIARILDFPVGVEVDDTRDLLFEISKGKGFTIYDISSPAPSRLGNIALELDEGLSPEVNQIEYDGSRYVLVSGGKKGFYVIDTQTPSTPVIDTHIQETSNSDGVDDAEFRFIDISGSYAYVTVSSPPNSYFQGFYVYNISDSKNVTKEAEASEFFFGDLKAVGNKLYLVDGDDLVEYNITDKTAPSRTQDIDLGSSQKKRIEADGSDIYISMNNGFVKYTAENFGSPDVRTPATGNGVYDIVPLGGDEVMWLHHHDGLFTSKKSGTWSDGNIDLGVTTVYDVAKNGDYAYIATGEIGLSYVDISTFTSPTSLNQSGGISYVYAVKVRGNHAFLADGYNGLTIVDITDQNNPQILGGYPVAGQQVVDLEVSADGNTAYLASGGGVTKVDTTNKLSPSLDTSENFGGNSASMLLWHGSSLIALVSDGVYALDTDLNIQGSKLALSSPTSGFVQGDELWLVESDAKRVDLSDYNSMSVIGTVASSTIDNAGAKSVISNGDYIYISSDNGRLYSFAKSNLNTPLYSVNLDTQGERMRFDGSRLYLSAMYDGVYAIKVDNPNYFAVESVMGVLGIARDVYVGPSYTYVADSNAGFSIHNNL